jgi:glycine cleavage system T protein (aminomethyltransferase)
MSETSCELKQTVLYQKHHELNARLVPFAGWCMPVQYESIISEHLHTRSEVSIFDISHMGEFFVKGERAEEDVNRLVTCDIKGLSNGRCKYGFLLSNDGTVIDDLIVFKISSEEFLLVVNAARITQDKTWIMSNLEGGSVLIDESEDTAKIDVQGPRSEEALNAVFDPVEIREIKRFGFRYITWKGNDILISGTGYTGEKGYEIFMPKEFAAEIWDALLAIDNVKPAGLGARDSLRLEVGYPLYGHDIDAEHTPFESGLDRFVCLEKDFIGKQAIVENEASSKRVLAGFVCDGRRSAREGFKVFIDDVERGYVTSGVFSPCLKKGIGYCRIDQAYSDIGQKIVLSDGKVLIAAEVVNPPFINK